MLAKFLVTILDMQPKNLYKPHVRTNTGKQMISLNLLIFGSLSHNTIFDTFSKSIKNFLLSEQ